MCFMRCTFVLIVWIVIMVMLLSDVSIEGFMPVAKSFKSPQKLAIACLTRGYEHIKGYDTLIKRNRSLDTLVTIIKDLYEVVDVVIFHEGNIPLSHQQHIQNATQNMPIKFVDVQTTGTRAFSADNHRNMKANDIIFPTECSDQFSIGYKHMCHFWFIDFIECMHSYTHCIRIDEDCTMIKFPIDVIQRMDASGVVFVTPYYNAADASCVVNGMEETSLEFMKAYNIIEQNKVESINNNPYTNMCIVNMAYFRSHEMYKLYAEHIHKSMGIYINRWGDLPLWGYVLANLVPKEKYTLDTGISYFHGSHNAAIN